MSQASHEADHISTSEIMGDVHCQLSCTNRILKLDTLAADHLNINVLAGIPFQEGKGIAVRPGKNHVIIHGLTLYMLRKRTSTSHILLDTHMCHYITL